jgi:rare lipoprotein A
MAHRIPKDVICRGLLWRSKAGTRMRGIQAIVVGRRIGGGLDRRARAGAVLAICVALGGCASSGPFAKHSKYSPKVVADGEPVPKGGGTYKVGQPYRLNGKTYTPSEHPYRGEGIASWYGPDFHGRLTANGEVYDMHSISAAHPTMPLPSYARVTNLENGRSIVVRVNDRGPYARNRVIDMSVGAAQALDFYKRGVARVRVEYVGRAPMEGSDDRVLLATLRHGRPAPVPSERRIAALTPLSPLVGPWRGVTDTHEQDEPQASADPPVPVARPSRIGATASGGIPVRPHRTDSSRVVLRGAEPSRPISVSAPPATTSAFAPVQNDVGLALMSGRGLY